MGRGLREPGWIGWISIEKRVSKKIIIGSYVTNCGSFDERKR